MKRRYFTFIAVLFLLGFIASLNSKPVYSGPIVKEIYYQKKTTLAYPAIRTFRFSLWNTEAGGTAPLWFEEKPIDMTSATIKTYLGEFSSLDGVDFSQQLWVQVERKRNDGSYVPVGVRDMFVVVPYALHSETTSGVPDSIGAVIAGQGLTGGGTSGDVTLNVGPGTGITVGVDAISVNFAGSGSAVTAARSDHTHGGVTTLPIGAIIDWWRPDATWAVPSDFAICDGSIVNDAGSPLNGKTLPNLTNRFIMGVTNVSNIGITGGSSDHAHTVDINHDHSAVNTSSAGAYTGNTAWAVDHNHAWAWGYNGDWQSWRAGGEGELMILWDNGIGNDGSGNYPIGSPFTDSGRWYTEMGGSHAHQFSTGSHTHSVDLLGLGVLNRSTTTVSNVPPYYGLLKIMRIK